MSEHLPIRLLSPPEALPVVGQARDPEIPRLAAEQDTHRGSDAQSDQDQDEERADGDQAAPQVAAGVEEVGVAGDWARPWKILEMDEVDGANEGAESQDPEGANSSQISMSLFMLAWVSRYAAGSNPGVTAWSPRPGAPRCVSWEPNNDPGDPSPWPSTFHSP